MFSIEANPLIFYVLTSILLLFFALIFFLLTLGPTQYDPYSPDLVDVTQESQNGETVKIDPDSFYGTYTQMPDDVKFALRTETSVTVVVVGDIGRSPRMVYHALSLAGKGAMVQVVGFIESEPNPALLSNPNITLHALRPTPRALQTSSPLLFPLLAPLKVLHLTLTLYTTLSACKPTQYLLIQNPPSIPLLFLAKLLTLLRNQKLIIDWHNFGYSILALKLGRNHPLVLLAKVYEYIFARTAHVHFAVTEAMAKKMKKSMGVTAIPLHDRPAAIFQPLKNQAERSKILQRLEQTAAHAGQIEKGDWKLIVSSTSWTADEDFELLLDALVGYCKQASSTATNSKSSNSTSATTKLPYILALITGRGPLLPHYLKRISALQQSQQLPHVTITTAWLSTADYAALLSVADLGISLHKSSSGVDLPMKVVDMFGAGLPVVGYARFEAWGELVKEGENGRGFGTAAELEEVLVELFGGKGGGGVDGKGNGEEKLRRLREGAVKEGERRWDDEWDRVVGGPVFKVC